MEIRWRGSGGGGEEEVERGGGEDYLKYRKLNHGSDKAIYSQCNVNG